MTRAFATFLSRLLYGTMKPLVFRLQPPRLARRARTDLCGGPGGIHRWLLGLTAEITREQPCSLTRQRCRKYSYASRRAKT